MGDENQAPTPNVDAQNPYGIAWACTGGETLKNSGLSCLSARDADMKYGISWETFCEYKVPAYRHGGGWGKPDNYFYVSHKDCQLLKKRFADEREQKLKDLHGDGYEAFKVAEKKREEEAMDRADEQKKIEEFKESVGNMSPYFESWEAAHKVAVPNGTDEFESEMFNKTESKRNFKMNEDDMKQVAGVQVGKKTMWLGADLFQFATRYGHITDITHHSPLYAHTHSLSLAHFRLQTRLHTQEA